MRATLLRLRRLPFDPVAVDWTLAVVLAVGGELAIWVGSDAANHRAAESLATPAMSLPIAVRRRYPAVVGTVVSMLEAVGHVIWGNAQFIGLPIAYICALYALTVWTSARHFALGFTLTMSASLVASAIGKSSFSQGVFFTLVAAVIMLLVRRVIGDRERRTRVAERERDVAAREAVVEERARIARELHDAIAHDVSMMVVQAGAERRVIEKQTGSTHEVLETIEQIGRRTLNEMRRLVGILRSDSQDPLAPQPTLGDLPALVAQVREAGLSVDLRIEGDRRALPVGIELSAYRIVQEALTNALKHGGNAHATVDVRYSAETLELEIVDDGNGEVVPIATGGHGLVGMRERVALYGGRFDAGRRQAGGFGVRVVLPIR